jgi:S-DNA-T family DNA segregation ATPase FtsK/SpoIIIE
VSLADTYSAEYQRLLPAALEEKLKGWLARCAGAALCLASLAGWLSILTWSVADPSLTLHRLAPTRNLLGYPGAVLSDLLLQTLGFAAVFLLFPAVMWGLELLSAQRIGQFRSRAALLPFAVLALATGCSALPMAANWPLHSGYGGLLGDLFYNAVAGAAGAVTNGQSTALVGLVLFSGGLAALTYCVGLVGQGGAASMGAPEGYRPHLPRFVWRARGAAAPVAAPLEPVFSGTGEPGLGETLPILEEPFQAAAMRPAPRPEREPALEPGVGQAMGSTPGLHEETGGREPDFDLSTDLESSAIAARFAPPGARRRPTPVVPEPPAVAPSVASPARPPRRPQAGYRQPNLQLLKRPAGGRPGPELTKTVLRGTARLLEDVLADFGVKAEIRDIKPGPVVTLFEIEPARGTKTSRVIALADDIARSMSATGVRLAVIPGRNAIGIELPNARREPVLLRELLESEAFRRLDAALPLVLGKSIAGEPIVADLARLPHLLVAGTTGSGKSVGLNAMVLSLLYRLSPEQCRLIMIDPKMLELSAYNGIPHLLCPVVTDPEKAVAALNWVVREMEERYKRMAHIGVRSIEVFNNRVRNARASGSGLKRTVQVGFDRRTGKALYEVEQLALESMPHIVVIIDEFADLMIAAGKEIEAALQRIAQMARAAGIHVIMATQRPSVDVVTGTLKANFPARIAYKVASKIDSRTILGEQGAENLLGQGDMLFSTGSAQPVRVHGPFVSDEEVDAVAAFLREQGEARYVEGVTDAPEDTPEDGSETVAPDDQLYDKAVALVLRDRKAQPSQLQRRLGISYAAAARLIERMAADGIVGPANSAGRRQVLISPGDAVAAPA